MKRQVKWMVYGIMLLLSVGCREDIDALYGVKGRPGIPVCFTTAWLQDETRLKRGIEGKKNFKDTDVIHVSAEFTLDPQTTDSKKEEKVTKYTILTLENGAWVNTRTEEQYEMTWPWNATGDEWRRYGRLQVPRHGTGQGDAGRNGVGLQEDSQWSGRQDALRLQRDGSQRYNQPCVHHGLI